MQATINSFLNELNKNPRWNQFKSEVQKKLNAELAKLKDSIGEDKWENAERNYNQILKKLTSAQKQMDIEVGKTLKSIKKSAAEIEKTIQHYKKLALKEKGRQTKKAKTKTAAKRSTAKTAIKTQTTTPNKPNTASRKATMARPVATTAKNKRATTSLRKTGK